MTDLEKKVKAVTLQVAIAKKAANDASGAAAVGINPSGVYAAVSRVCAAAVRQLDALHADELRREMAVNSRAVSATVRKFTASHATRHGTR